MTTASRLGEQTRMTVEPLAPASAGSSRGPDPRIGTPCAAAHICPSSSSATDWIATWPPTWPPPRQPTPHARLDDGGSARVRDLAASGRGTASQPAAGRGCQPSRPVRDRLSNQTPGVAKHHAGMGGGRPYRGVWLCDLDGLGSCYGPPRRPWVRGGSYPPSGGTISARTPSSRIGRSSSKRCNKSSAVWVITDAS